MDLTILTSLGALAVGAAAAGLAGPSACGWPAKGQAMLRRLKAVKAYRPLGRVRTAAGGVALAGLLTGCAFAAYAAAPAVAAPERLPGEVQGVIGSGDQLSLRLKDAAGEQTLKPGEEYQDGWTLQAVTPTTATLARDGMVRQVGLNAAGAVRTGGDDAPSQVTVVGEPCGAVRASAALDLAGVDRLYAAAATQLGPLGRPLPYVEQPGLSADENRRLTAYNQLIRLGVQSCRASGIASPGVDSMLAGTAYDDWRVLEVKRIDNRPPAVGVTRGLIIQLPYGQVVLESGQDPMEAARKSDMVTMLDGVPVPPLYPPTRAELAARRAN